MFKKVFSLIMVTLLVFALAGCGTKETPEQAITNALNALKVLDKATVSKYMDYDSMVLTEGESNEIDKNNQLFLENLTFNLKEANISGDTATVEAEVTNINMPFIFNEYISRYISSSLSISVPAEGEEVTTEDPQEVSDRILKEVIEEKKTETVTNNITINLYKEGGNWKIEVDEDLQNAVFGNFLSLYGDEGEVTE